MAICFVSGKIQTAYVCVIHCAPWVFPLPRISPFLNSLRILNFSTACYERNHPVAACLKFIDQFFENFLHSDEFFLALLSG